MSAVAKKTAKSENHDQRIAELLDNTNWADDFAWTDLKMLSKYIHLEQFLDASEIFKEGSLDRSMGVLIEGKINIIKGNCRDGKKEILAVLNPPQTFGEMSLLDHEPRSATAVAAGKTLVLFMTHGDFEKLLDEQPALGCKVLLMLSRMMSRRLRKASGRLLEYLNQT